MAQRTTQEGGFMSPYSDQERVDPEAEVCNIVQEVESSSYLNPTVEKFLQDHDQKELFLEVFARQANIIKSRCQSFDECHVTVYDKVLLALTENGNRFDAAAAQEYFCEEFLGISRDGSKNEADRILDQNVVLKAMVARAAYPRGGYGEKYSSETVYTARNRELQASGSAVPTARDEKAAKVARLAAVYEKAKLDYESIPANDHDAKLEAVRFLRDTAENTVIYLRNINTPGGPEISPELMADLELTCKSANALVVTLSGGRKRKFDQHDYTIPSAAPRGFGFRGRAAGRNPPRGSSSRRDSRPRAYEWSSQYHPGRSSSHYRTDEDCQTIGYNRPVDSYQPVVAAAAAIAAPRPRGSSGRGASHSHPQQQTSYRYEASRPVAGVSAEKYEPRDYGSRDHDYGSEYRQGRGQGHSYEYGYDDGHARDYERRSGPYRPSSGGGGGSGSTHHRPRGY